MHRWIGLLLLIFAAVGMFGLVIAEETPDASDLGKKQMETIEAMRPGPEHQFLATLEGEWDLDIEMWLPPGGESQKFTATGTNTMILGGRFLDCRSWGEMMGNPLENVSIVGFDRRYKKYTAVGFDNMGTYSVSASGDYNEDSKTLRLFGTDHDPIFDFTQEYSFQVTFIDDDHYRWQVYFFNPEMTGGADSAKVVDIEYTRSK